MSEATLFSISEWHGGVWGTRISFDCSRSKALGIVLLQVPTGGLFFTSKAPLHPIPGWHGEVWGTLGVVSIALVVEP